MAINQTNRLVWIVETIHTARKISFDELKEKWDEDEEISNGDKLIKRTFHKWRWNIYDTFGLIIDCEKFAPYRYYIVNMDDMKNNKIGSWILSAYSVSNSLAESKSIRDRILLEEIPSGREYLKPILDAMRKNRFIHITYYNYSRNDTYPHYFMPLCVKLFRQRWYVVGRLWPTLEDHLFCLDRIRDFRLSSHSFEYPLDFSPTDYFADCFGIIVDKKQKAENVLLKVNARQANYLRDLPLHESQEETERNEKYSIFKLYVRPTYDFRQELLWNNEELEVLKPLWLREEIANTIKRMANKYKTNKKGKNTK